MQKKIKKKGLTFDDVLLFPGYADFLPKSAVLQTFFSKNIPLNIPLVSAAMDTVSEWLLAREIARLGGMAAIHKNMSIIEQANQVAKVKRAQSAMIVDPIKVYDTDTLGKVLELQKEYGINSFPVVSKDNKIVGIITRSNVRFQKNLKTPVSKIMTKNPISVLLKNVKKGEDIDIEKTKKLFKQNKIEKILVRDEKNILVGLITSRDVENRQDYPKANLDSEGRLRVAAAVGTADDTLERIQALVDAGVDAIIIDTAHGHSKKVIELLIKAKKLHPKTDIIAGNVATKKGAEELIKAGADGIKVGIGPGSICTTRIIAGIGVPQLTAIMDVFAITQKHNIPLIADGGIRYSGDIVKALAAGASCIMAGSLFAGVDESPGETIISEGRKFKSYRGMGSVEAMQQGSKDRYFQADEFDVNKLVPEGISGKVPYKGMLKEVVHQLIGGIQAGMGYTGCKTIEQLKHKAEFIQITAAGIKESHPHDVTITKESPNYSR